MYRASDDGWLVSEVGRDGEGRGRDVTGALAALASNSTGADWWDAVPAAVALELDEDERLADAGSTRCLPSHNL